MADNLLEPHQGHGGTQSGPPHARGLPGQLTGTACGTDGPASHLGRAAPSLAPPNRAGLGDGEQMGGYVDAGRGGKASSCGASSRGGGRVLCAAQGGSGASCSRVASAAQRHVPALHKAETRWQPGSAQVEDPAEEERQKVVKSVLNKLTQGNFIKLSDKLLGVSFAAQKTLEGLVHQLFDAAVGETRFGELYAQLCQTIDRHMPTFGSSAPGGHKVDFRRLLLNSCGREFEAGVVAMQAVSLREDARGQRHGGTRDVTDAATGQEVQDAARELQARQRMLGAIQFMGQLYQYGMLTEKVMHSCIQSLLQEDANPRMEDMETLCSLLRTIGQALDRSNKHEYRAATNVYFKRMDRASKSQQVEARIRFMLQEVLDMRANRWARPEASARAPVNSSAARSADRAGRRDSGNAPEPLSSDAVARPAPVSAASTSGLRVLGSEAASPGATAASGASVRASRPAAPQSAPLSVLSTARQPPVGRQPGGQSLSGLGQAGEPGAARAAAHTINATQPTLGAVVRGAAMAVSGGGVEDLGDVLTLLMGHGPQEAAGDVFQRVPDQPSSSSSRGASATHARPPAHLLPRPVPARSTRSAGSPPTTPAHPAAPPTQPRLEPPDELCCPITMALLVDPVLAADGRLYSRAVIEEWLQKSSMSPMTGQALASRVLTPCYPVRAMVSNWREQHGLATP